MTVDPRLLERFAELRASFPLFAQHCLKLRTKEGTIEPVVLNSAQLLLHEHVEEQKARTGKVRMLVPKGRQMGVSTYFEGRFYHNTSMNRGRNTMILAHEQSASDALFGIVDRYQKHNPFAPSVGASNVRELVFDKLDSSYAVSTAGSKAGGRGKSMSNFHGSEVAFWPNAVEHFAASVQTVPDIAGTEIALESTANGVVGEFYERVQDGIRGKGDYEVCFLPWFMATEYVRDVPDGFELDDDRADAIFSEREYMETFELTLEQMAWRRNKIQELGSRALFDQEYPASLALAFQQKAQGAYHNVGDILRARKRTGVAAAGPLILGVDPAGEGGDRFAIAHRRGYVCEKIDWRDKIDAPTAVQWLKSVIDESDPAVVFIDAGGLGGPIIQQLRTYGPRYNVPHVRAVNFGATAQGKLARPHAPGPKNRRAEMQKRIKEWLGLEEGVSIPDLDDLQADLVEMRIKPSLTNDLTLESKHEIKGRGGRSPDLADALGLTFADLTYIANFTPAKKTPKFGDPDSHPTVIAPTAYEVDVYGGDDGWMG